MKKLSLIFCFMVRAAFSYPDTNEVRLDAASWTGHVYLAIIGDSLPAGGGGSGGGINALPIGITNASGYFSITNGSVGGARWIHMPGQLISVLARTPRWVFVHVGINDVNNCFITNQFVPCDWPVISSNLDFCASNCNAAGARMMVGEIFPAYTNITTFGTPGTHLYNEYFLSNWCSTNVFSTITKEAIQHDSFGQTNPGTGQLDWLKENYAQSAEDGLHLSLLAYTNWGPLVVSNLSWWYPSRWKMSTSLGRVGRVIHP